MRPIRLVVLAPGGVVDHDGAAHGVVPHAFAGRDDDPDADTDAGWTTVLSTPTSIDLFDAIATSVFLASAVVPAGRVAQITTRSIPSSCWRTDRW